jgi:hypothetical protein
MKKINVFLDDERNPTFIKDKLQNFYPIDWVVITNYFDFVKFVDSNINKIKLVSFDHDISSFDETGKEWTGKDAADYLINKCLDGQISFPDFFVHTANVSGRPNIISSILNYLKHIENNKLDFKYFNSGFINGQII